MNNIVTIKAAPPRQIGLDQVVRLGMAELAPDGFSEQWLLRFGGDVHWLLIADAMGKEQAVFQDIYGRPVYAAFCATSLLLPPPQCHLLGEEVCVSSKLYLVGKNQIGSEHMIHLNGQLIARLGMISAFVSHGTTKLNKHIVRNEKMPYFMLPQAPDSLIALAQRARANARNLGDAVHGQKVLETTPCPSLDFNAVGLLYFPTFSKLAEIAEWSGGAVLPLVRREITYLGNIDQSDTVRVFRSGSRMVMTRDDGKVIGKVETIRKQVLNSHNSALKLSSP